MAVPVRETINKNAWIFLKPLTPGMWFGTIMVVIYTGVVIWLLELLGNNNVDSPISRQSVTSIYFSMFEEKEKVKRLISRIVLLVWLFFILVLKSSYTASLTSMLTVQQLQPTVNDIHELLKNGEYVGCGSGSFVMGLLEELGFSRSKIKPYHNSEDIHNALSRGSKNGGIAALVGEIPYLKLFLAKNCKKYTIIGPIYKTAGFGYAFPKGSPLVGDISQAILNITGGDTIIRIEQKWIRDKNSCQNEGSIIGSGSLTFASFEGPIILTGVVSTSSLMIALIMYFYRNEQIKPRYSDSEQI